MKEYLVVVEKVQQIKMIVREKNEVKALNKVISFINKCSDYDVNINKIFDEKPYFKYSIQHFKNVKGAKQ